MTETKPVWKVDKEAELQEFLAGVSNVALAIAKLYASLCHAGMTNEDALTITLEWLRLTFGKKDA